MKEALLPRSAKRTREERASGAAAAAAVRRPEGDARVERARGCERECQSKKGCFGFALCFFLFPQARPAPRTSLAVASHTAHCLWRWRGGRVAATASALSSGCGRQRPSVGKWRPSGGRVSTQDKCILDPDLTIVLPFPHSSS